MKIKQLFGIAFVALMWSGVGFGMQKTATAPSSAAQTNEQECVFCLEAEGELSKPVDCQHMMHQQPCMQAWRAQGQNSCPVCRRDVFFVGEDRAQVTQRVAAQKVAVAQRTQAEQIEADRAFAEELDPEARNRFEVTQQRLAEFQLALQDAERAAEAATLAEATAMRELEERKQARLQAIREAGILAEIINARNRAYDLMSEALSAGALQKDFPKITFGTIAQLNNLGINFLPANFFAHVRNLERIVLSYSPLEIIDENAFNGLDALDYLELSSNNMKSITPGALSKDKLENLTMLGLLGNHFSLEEKRRIKEEVGPWVVIRWGERFALPKDPTLDNLVEHAAVPALEMGSSGMRAMPEQVVILNLSGVGLVSVEGLGRLPGIQEVQYLKLQDNQLKSLPVGELAQLKQLKILNLRDNKLSAEEQERIRQEVGPDVKVYF